MTVATLSQSDSQSNAHACVEQVCKMSSSDCKVRWLLTAPHRTSPAVLLEVGVSAARETMPMKACTEGSLTAGAGRMSQIVPHRASARAFPQRDGVHATRTAVFTTAARLVQ
ncbi:hypothetical protein AAFF_G00248220 [Aldrovandia affinis]|uniref:Uncharacterized protein n=1 Tax=Aldrovandia affinis TaxID=143900 RepID=A0AAD7RDT3_9TELE|nr:hypothetical protein AAFF_G00248220 [Aldrovandia affinis]